MGLRTLISNRISNWALGHKKIRRELLRQLWTDDVLFFRNFDDHSLVYYPHDVIGEHLTKFGEFSREPVRELAEYLTRSGQPPEGGSVLEVGANIGTHTVYFFRDLHCNSVVAIEPDPENHELLCRNVQINDLNDKVTILRVGASAKSGQLPFVTSELNRGGSKIGEAQDNAIMVDVTTVDSLLETQAQSLQDLRLIWIDVEGHELQVLQGALRTLGEVKPPVYLEYTPKKDASENEKLRDILFEAYDHVVDFANGQKVLTRESFNHIHAQTDLLAMNLKSQARRN